MFCIVGLPETVVKESKERVRAALLNSRKPLWSQSRLSEIGTKFAVIDIIERKMTGPVLGNSEPKGYSPHGTLTSSAYVRGSAPRGNAGDHGPAPQKSYFQLRSVSVGGLT